jgi:aminodeoxyfutalosine deaminase
VDTRTFTARWILLVDGPALERGTITVRGERIESVHPFGEQTADDDFGDAVIIPGLVNAHTHLDLSGAAGRTIPVPGEPFPEWLTRVIAFRRGRTPEQTAADIQRGLAESLRHGVTLLGDISAGGTSWPQLVKSPLRAVVFWELIGTTLARFQTSIQAATLGMAPHPNAPQCHWGTSPHAPYTVHRQGYELAAQLPGIQAVHLAESAAEMELLKNRTGSFVPFLQSLGVWEPDGLIREPGEFLQTNPELRSLFIHGNFLPGDTLLTANQSLVICPRTHVAFGHPPHPFREFLARGVNVGIGTDSAASNPDLDVLAELQELHRRYPDVPGETLLKMGTLNGAKALGFDDVCGSLTMGKSADFVVLECVATDDPYEAILSGAITARRTMFRGTWR